MLMRKICWAILLSLLLATPAGASQASQAATETPGITVVSFTGKIVAGRTVSVTAPFGGTVQDFNWRAGDAVSAGGVLLSLSTDKVYAPVDGVARSLRAQPGDSCEAVQSRYSALALIEPDSRFQVQGNSKSAYDSTATKYVHAGETVYLQASKKSRVGEGFISAVKGSSYTVEVTGGNLKLGDSVSIYRSADHSRKTRVGKGSVARMDPVAVTGEGSVLRVHVKEDAQVKKGDLLFETVTGDLLGALPLDEMVRFPERGAIATLAVAPGDVVTEGQVLVTMYPTGTLEASIAVGEMELSRVKVGDRMTIAPDADADRSYQGTVASISSVSTGQDGDAEYTAYLTFDNDDFVREGMSIVATKGP